jgi:hypothetical protein
VAKRNRRQQGDTPVPRDAAPVAAAAPVAVARDPNELHITVAAVTDMSGLHVDLRHETGLVKAALLYADRVTRASPSAVILASEGGFVLTDQRARIDPLVATMMRTLSDRDDDPALYERLRRQSRLSLRERFTLRSLERLFDEAAYHATDMAAQRAAEAGAAELAQAVAMGAVDIHTLGTERTATSDDFAEAVVEGLGGLLADSVSAGTRTFPLFDDGAGSLLRSMVAEGRVADARSTRATEVGIAGALLAGLDAFPNAEMDVVLDVREQLRNPLVHFRSALAKASREFTSEAWDESFRNEVEDLYRIEVAPELDRLRTALDDLGAKATLLRAASTVEGVATLATLGLAAAAAVELAHLPALVYGASPLGGAVTVANEALERRRVRRAAEGSGYYFLYQADRALAG